MLMVPTPVIPTRYAERQARAPSPAPAILVSFRTLGWVYLSLSYGLFFRMQFFYSFLWLQTNDSNAGYTGSGTQCYEINNCALGRDTHLCSIHADCRKTGPGTNSCTCKPGFRGDGQVSSCYFSRHTTLCLSVRSDPSTSWFLTHSVPH